MTPHINPHAEWLEADGLGGFASGTVSGIRTRRYHALLLTATTPRIGKPVEVEALWLNALWIGSRFAAHWKDLYTRSCETFRARFWNEAGGYLYDVIDVDHQPGTADAPCRPNQIFAVGGLPLVLLEPEPAWRVVETVESRLWTPLGLRSLAPGEPGYTPRYEGGVHARYGAYHQGTVWPWLIGPFVEA
jgi:predicted glycogen debranching enzyme